MEGKTNFLEPLLDRAEDYSKTSLEIIKLKTVATTAGVGGTLASGGVVILAVSIFSMIVNIGLALWLGDLMGKSYLGFFCVAGFYGIAALALHFLLGTAIKTRVTKTLIAQMLN